MATFVGTSSVAVAASFPNLHGFKTLTENPVCLRSSGRIGTSTGFTSRRRLAFNPDHRVAKIMAASTTETEKSGIKIVSNPTESKLSDLGVRSWPNLAIEVEVGMSSKQISMDILFNRDMLPIEGKGEGVS